LPRRLRDHKAGLIFHVLNRSAKRLPLFERDGDYDAFLRLLPHAGHRENVAILAYCLMPNHWHLVITPKTDGALSRFMHWLTTTHARRWQIAHGTEGQGAVYQGRFRAIPLKDDGHFLWVCRYVERNALRASLVDRAEAWRWSSLWCRTRQGEGHWLAKWPLEIPADWCALVNAPQTAAELEHFRRAMEKGEPFGDAEWSATLQKLLGRSRGRPRGRPRLSSKNDSRPPYKFV
jgi:putative transposase